MRAKESIEVVVSRIAEAARAVGRAPDSIRLIAVSKTFGVDAIRPVLSAGHRTFGENRVQEAQSKWPDLRQEFPDLELHLIGPLQSNKTRDAVRLFDVIHTIDRVKIARAIANEMHSAARHLQLFVQVNTGEEPQKAGLSPTDVKEFVTMCRDDLKLDLTGLMCIPPIDEEPAVHFALLGQLAEATGLKGLSMGMSADFETAIEFGATHVRVGSAIFGARPAAKTDLRGA
ncbi:MAG: YggS family pyridoxal phosphate-dependent enzyme [Hyphomicrobiaceae bacterium]